MSVFDKLCDFVHDVFWYFEVERPVNEVMKEFSKEMDQAISDLEKVRDSSICTTIDELKSAIESGSVRIVIKECAYQAIINDLKDAMQKKIICGVECRFYYEVPISKLGKWFCMNGEILDINDSLSYELIIKEDSNVIILNKVAKRK